MELGKKKNCENFWIFMELGKKVRIVRYELRIQRKKSELWEFLNIYGIGWKSQNCENFWIFMELGKQSQNCAFF